MRKMAALFDHFETRTMYQPLILLATFDRNDLILTSPNHQGRNRLHTRQQHRQTRVMHVGLPAIAGRGLPVDHMSFALLGVWLSTEQQLVVGHLFEVEEGETPGPLAAVQKYIGDFAILRT